MTHDTQAAAERLRRTRAGETDVYPPMQYINYPVPVFRDLWTIEANHEDQQAELREILALLDDQRLLMYEIHAQVKARLQRLVGDETEGT